MSAATAPAPAPLSPQLQQLLQEAVAQGVITVEQADALARLSPPALPPPPPPPAAPATRLPRPQVRGLLTEVLGYVGAAVAFVSGIVLGSQLWDELAAWSRVGVLALLTVVTAAGALGLRGRTGAVGRLASFLWGVAVVGFTATVGVAAADVVDLSGPDIAVTAATAGTVAAAAVWWRRRTGLQHVLLFAGLLATPLIVLARVDDSLAESFGFLIWGIGLAWLMLASRDLVPPVAVARAAGSAALLLGPIMVGSVGRTLPLLLGLATAGTLLTLAIRAGRGLQIGLAIAGIFVYLPATFAEVFRNTLGALSIAFVSGIALVAVSVGLARVLQGDGDERHDHPS